MSPLSVGPMAKNRYFLVYGNVCCMTNFRTDMVMCPFPALGRRPKVTCLSRSLIPHTSIVEVQLLWAVCLVRSNMYLL